MATLGPLVFPLALPCGACGRPAVWERKAATSELSCPQCGALDPETHLPLVPRTDMLYCQRCGQTTFSRGRVNDVTNQLRCVTCHRPWMLSEAAYHQAVAYRAANSLTVRLRLGRVPGQLFCQGCKSWIPKPGRGKAPECPQCGELYETTRYINATPNEGRLGIRGWYPKDLWSTPPTLPSTAGDPRVAPGAHYRDVVFVEETPKPPASRWKYVVSGVLAVGVALVSYVLSH